MGFPSLQDALSSTGVSELLGGYVTYPGKQLSRLKLNVSVQPTAAAIIIRTAIITRVIPALASP